MKAQAARQQPSRPARIGVNQVTRSAASTGRRCPVFFKEFFILAYLGVVGPDHPHRGASLMHRGYCDPHQSKP